MVRPRRLFLPPTSTESEAATTTGSMIRPRRSDWLDMATEIERPSQTRALTRARNSSSDITPDQDHHDSYMFECNDWPGCCRGSLSATLVQVDAEGEGGGHDLTWWTAPQEGQRKERKKKGFFTSSWCK